MLICNLIFHVLVVSTRAIASPIAVAHVRAVEKLDIVSIRVVDVDGGVAAGLALTARLAVVRYRSVTDVCAGGVSRAAMSSDVRPCSTSST